MASTSRFRRTGRISSASDENPAAIHKSKTTAKAPREKLPRRYKKGLAGTARQVVISEGSSKGFSSKPIDVLNFRLDVTDKTGNVVEHIPIEMRASEIPGRVIRDGDRVVVKGKRTRRGFVEARGVYVINSGLVIEPRGRGATGFFGNILALPLGLAFLCAWPALVVGLIGGMPIVVAAAVVVLVVYWAIYIRK